MNRRPRSYLKRDDTVVAISGASAGAGRTGKIVAVLPERGRALVEGFNLVKKCLRKSQDHPQGGIVEKEAPIALSNLLLYCPHCKKGVRIRRDRDGERKVRRCRVCGHDFDA